MTRSETLLALADRCEAAMGPDRDLDAEIAVTVSGDAGAWVVTASPDSIFSHQPGWWRDGADKSHSAPAFCVSLDAAMGLVPEGWRWWKAGDGATGGSRMVVVDTAEGGRFTIMGQCPCPETKDRNALALTVAVLRALATQHQESGE